KVQSRRGWMRLVRIQPHDVTPGAGVANVPEARSFECRHVAHESIAGRAGQDRVGLQNPRALQTGMSGGGLNEFRCHSLAPKLSLDEEANERPNPFFRFARQRRAAERAIACSWRNRTPC